MTRFLAAFSLILLLLAVVACSGDDSGEESFTTSSTSSADAFDMAMTIGESTMASAPQQPAAAAAPEAMMEKAMASDSGAAGSPGGTLQLADRKIISTGNITVEVDDVESSVKAVGGHR